MNKKQLTLKLSALAVSVLLASCGGGGDGYYGSTNSNSGGNTGGSTVLAVNVTNVVLYDAANAVTTSITAAGVTAKVKVTDASGKAISGARVTFNGEGVVFGTSNAAVLSNADGEASISVKPESLDANGTYQISAAADFNGTTASSKLPLYFTLQAANIVIANMVAANTSLESGASTNITADSNPKCNTFVIS